MSDDSDFVYNKWSGDKYVRSDVRERWFQRAYEAGYAGESFDVIRAEAIKFHPNPGKSDPFYDGLVTRYNAGVRNRHDPRETLSDVETEALWRLVGERNAARAKRDFAESDRIRDLLLSFNIHTEDERTGSRYYGLWRDWNQVNAIRAYMGYEPTGPGILDQCKAFFATAVNKS